MSEGTHKYVEAVAEWWNMHRSVYRPDINVTWRDVAEARQRFLRFDRQVPHDHPVKSAVLAWDAMQTRHMDTGRVTPEQRALAADSLNAALERNALHVEAELREAGGEASP